MFGRFLNSQSKTITSAAFILGSASLGSKILGLFRDRLLAGHFGAGDELDMYYAAFRIPDLVFNLLIIGAISAAFIPVFTEFWARNQKEAWLIANGVLNLFLAVLIFLSIILIFFCPMLISIITPGFEGEKKEITVALTRIMFLSPLFLAVSNIFSGILQSFKRFFVYSMAPIMYNIGTILGILFFVPKIGVYGLAFGVVLGAFLHMAIQIPSAKFCGYRYRFVFNIYHQGIRKIIKLMVPRTIGLGAFQINLIVITAIASTLASGSIAVFNLSNNFQYIPVGIIGISFATAAFPSLSQEFAIQRKKEFAPPYSVRNKYLTGFIQKFSSTFRQILFLIIPLSALIFILRAQIVRLVLGTGQFGWVDTRLTAACLGLFSLGIFAQSFTPLLSRAFYALHNTLTPVVISIFSMALNIGLSFLLVWLLTFNNIFYDFIFENLKLQGISEIAILGLPLAFSIAGIFNFTLLIFRLHKKLGDLDLKTISRAFFKILLATLVMAEITYLGLYILADLVNMQTFFGVFLQAAGAASIGFLAYLLIARFLNLYEFKKIINSIR
ncbi:MAG: murein biosynthesis integral membrane protein MurJ [Parcubacteria group bacterium CG08_land_8_20_14_0_20_38_56]|nr:MAG: murein biosynthesis integral membrane protein MurJ [Parcubacteria group bacterium CG08_land_8_20_14_0_20_38_56]